MKHVSVLAAALMFAAPSLADDTAAPAGRYFSDPAHSSVTWRVNHFGLSNYTARFAKVSAELDWHPEKPEASSLSATIDPISVRTDYPFPAISDFDKKLGEGADYLAGRPIRFVSRSIAVTGERTGKVTGDLTLRGETHPVTLDVRFNGSMVEHPLEKSPKVGFSAETTLKRSDWGLGIHAPAISDAITVLIEMEFASSKPQSN